MLATSGVALADRGSTTAGRTGSRRAPAEGGRIVVVRADPWSSTRPTSRPPGSTCAPRCTSTAAAPTRCIEASVFFSNFADQRLYRQDAGRRSGGADAGHRRRASVRRRQVTADGIVVDRRARTPRGRRHAREVVNELVAVCRPTARARPACWRRAATSTRRPGSHPMVRCCRSWPGICRGCRGMAASCSWRQLADDASVSRRRQVAGKDGEESIWGSRPGARPATCTSRATGTGWWNL